MQTAQSEQLTSSEHSLRQMETAKILATTTKVKERDQRNRKSHILLRKFFVRVARWQKERTALSSANKNIELLILLLLGEIEEVLEHRELEGLTQYDFKSEKGETIDVGFFLASLTYLLNDKGLYIDFDQVMFSANGQANNSNALARLTEVGGNLTLKSLEVDLQYLWTLWVSYLIHMKHPVNPNQVLTEYTFPKNDGNYIAKLLSQNPLFMKRYGREMNNDEQQVYFGHYRKATRKIRDFIIAFVDSQVEHTGLREEHYMPYVTYIYSFMSELGYSSDQALVLLEQQLYKDYGIQKTESGLLITKQLAFAN